MPNFIDIEENDVSYQLCFDVRNVPQKDLAIIASKNSLRVVASSQEFRADVTERETELDLKHVYYDKTLDLEFDVDIESVKYIYHAGILEITIDKLI